MQQHDDRSGAVVRLYLDIDGSICPLPDRNQAQKDRWSPPTDDWSEWVDPQAFNETPFPVELLDDLVTLDWVEVVWATTWPLDMIEHAPEKAGYESLRFRHLGASGIYDKFDAIEADVALDPKPFVWVEDHWFANEGVWEPPVPYRRVRPDPMAAITRSKWQQVISWLRSQADVATQVGGVLSDTASDRSPDVVIQSAVDDEVVFEIAQPDGAVALVEFVTSAMGDLWIDVDVNDRQGFLLACHSAEVELLVAVCRQWMTRESGVVLAEIDAIRRWLGVVTADRTATNESQHDLTSDLDWQAAVADGFARPSASECYDEHGWPLEIEPSGDGLLLTRPDDPEVSGAIAVSVANEHLHLLIAGLIWRTYGEGSDTFTLTTRHNTVAYFDALDQFERIVRHRL